MANVRAPVQERSTKTQEALVDALERLLASKSFNDITVAEIAAEAGVTTGAIYGRFRDKTGLLHAAFDRFHERSINTDLGREDEGHNDFAVLEQVVRATLNYTLEHIPLMRAASAINDDPSFDRMRTARNSVADELAGRFNSSEFAPEELNRRTRFMLRMVTAVARDTFLAGPGTKMLPKGQGRRPSAKQQRVIDQLVTDLVESAASYLRLSS